METLEQTKRRALRLVAETRGLNRRTDAARLRELLAEARRLQGELVFRSSLVPNRDRYQEGPARVPGERWRASKRRPRCSVRNPGCDGSGWILDRFSNVAHPCECRALRSRPGTRQLRRHMGRNAHLSLEAPPLSMLPSQALEAAGRIAGRLAGVGSASPAWGGWIEGPAGTGRSSLGAYLAGEAIRAGRSAEMWRLGELLGRLGYLASPARKPSEPRWEDELERLAGLELLVIDQLDWGWSARRWPSRGHLHLVEEPGAHRPRSVGLDRLALLLDERYVRELPLVAITEADGWSLRVHWAKRERRDLLSELLDAVRADSPLEGEDARVEARAERLLHRLLLISPTKLATAPQGETSGGVG